MATLTIPNKGFGRLVKPIVDMYDRLNEHTDMSPLNTWDRVTTIEVISMGDFAQLNVMTIEAEEFYMPVTHAWVFVPCSEVESDET